MKNIIAGLLIVFASCAGNKNYGIGSMPPCLVTKVDSLKKAPDKNSPNSVTEYSYKGQAVFYITSGCCDQMNEVYNSDCDYLGAPDGGITGKGDGKLPDFLKQ